MVKPYKLKHIPTGLYYQPLKYRGSNFSKLGKIYQTKTNILNLGYYSDGSPRKILSIGKLYGARCALINSTNF